MDATYRARDELRRAAAKAREAGAADLAVSLALMEGGVGEGIGPVQVRQALARLDEKIKAELGMKARASAPAPAVAEVPADEVREKRAAGRSGARRVHRLPGA